MCDLCFTLGDSGQNFDTYHDGSNMIISYNAYSTDSSFEETLYKFKFCPFCGTDLKSEHEKRMIQRQKEQEKEIAKRLKKERAIAKRNEELRLESVASSMIRLERLIQIGSYNIYSYDGVEYKASDKGHLKELFEFEGKEFVKSKPKFVAQFIKGVDQKKPIKKEKPSIIKSEVELEKKEEQPIIKSISPKERYTLNKNASVGDEVTCPSCKTNFLKRSYQQAFCSNKGKNNCKDNFWNNLVN